MIIEYTFKTPKLTLWFQAEGKVLKMKVLKQDESLRSALRSEEGEMIICFTSPPHPFRIQSSLFPQISLGCLYVRGVFLSDDDSVVSYKFNSPEQLADYLESVRKCLQEWEQDNEVTKNDELTSTIEFLKKSGKPVGDIVSILKKELNGS